MLFLLLSYFDKLLRHCNTDWDKPYLKWWFGFGVELIFVADEAGPKMFLTSKVLQKYFTPYNYQGRVDYLGYNNSYFVFLKQGPFTSYII